MDPDSDVNLNAGTDSSNPYLTASSGDGSSMGYDPTMFDPDIDDSSMMPSQLPAASCPTTNPGIYTGIYNGNSGGGYTPPAYTPPPSYQQAPYQAPLPPQSSYPQGGYAPVSSTTVGRPPVGAPGPSGYGVQPQAPGGYGAQSQAPAYQMQSAAPLPAPQGSSALVGESPASLVAGARSKDQQANAQLAAAQAAEYYGS